MIHLTSYYRERDARRAMTFFNVDAAKAKAREATPARNDLRQDRSSPRHILFNRTLMVR